MSGFTDRSRSRAIALHSDMWSESLRHVVRIPKRRCPHNFQSTVPSRHRSPGALTCATLGRFVQGDASESLCTERYAV
jgi:hypothetical protein